MPLDAGASIPLGRVLGNCGPSQSGVKLTNPISLNATRKTAQVQNPKSNVHYLSHKPPALPALDARGLRRRVRHLCGPDRHAVGGRR